MAKRLKAEVTKINANTVWAAACAALRINGEYLKDPKWDPETDKTTRPNKAVMRELMLTNTADITAEDYAQADVVQTYWRNKLMDVLAGTANTFTKQAVDFASQEEFASNDWLALATIAFLPEGYNRGIERDKQHMKKFEATMGSQHFGTIGEKISGKATIIDSRYSEKWGTYYNTAQFGGNVILFTFRKQLDTGKEVCFTGTVKSHRDDNITQLNRVRIMGEIA